MHITFPVVQAYSSFSHFLLKTSAGSCCLEKSCNRSLFLGSIKGHVSLLTHMLSYASKAHNSWVAPLPPPNQMFRGQRLGVITGGSRLHSTLFLAAECSADSLVSTVRLGNGERHWGISKSNILKVKKTLKRCPLEWCTCELKSVSFC